MNRIFLALGANVGNREQNIAAAIELLSEKVSNFKQASIYTSKAVGYTVQADFINTVIEGQTKLKPTQLLEFIKNIEKKVGRISRFRWGPREIDIDILFYDDLVYKNATLEIPHPRLHERDFVLVPLNELYPDFVHPVFQKTIRQLLQKILIDQRSILH